MASGDESRHVMNNLRDASPQQRAVEVWIASDLARRYDQALREPLPPDLLDLLSE